MFPNEIAFMDIPGFDLQGSPVTLVLRDELAAHVKHVVVPRDASAAGVIYRLRRDHAVLRRTPAIAEAEQNEAMTIGEFVERYGPELIVDAFQSPSSRVPTVCLYGCPAASALAKRQSGSPVYTEIVRFF